MRIDFYHLSAAPLERVLPRICEKLLADGGRLLVVTGPEQVERLDEQLWTYASESFLPHGTDDPERQPVLLSASPDAANGAANLALADGVWRDEALEFERTFYFFDSATIDGARAAWRALKEKEGAELHYWKQDGGKWVEGP